MKIYSQLIDLSKTTPQPFYVPPHSKFKLGVKLVQDVEFSVKKDDVALESDGEIDGFKTFSLESTNPGNIVYVVEATNGQKVKILQTTTTSTVFDVDSGSISINGVNPTDGNIDVSKLVYIDDDGGKAELPAKDITTSLKNIDASLENKLERSDIVPVAPSTDAPPDMLAGARDTAEFVNSSIATNTANFMGTFTNPDDFPKEATNNDYLFFDTVDEEGNKIFQRYKYTVTDYEGTTGWKYEYTLNNSSFTAAQWAAIQSGITSEIVNDIARKSELDAHTIELTGEYDDGTTFNYTVYVKTV